MIAENFNNYTCEKRFGHTFATEVCSFIDVPWVFRKINFITVIITQPIEGFWNYRVKRNAFCLSMAPIYAYFSGIDGLFGNHSTTHRKESLRRLRQLGIIKVYLLDLSRWGDTRDHRTPRSPAKWTPKIPALCESLSTTLVQSLYVVPVIADYLAKIR